MIGYDDMMDDMIDDVRDDIERKREFVVIEEKKRI